MAESLSRGGAGAGAAATAAESIVFARSRESIANGIVNQQRRIRGVKMITESFSLPAEWEPHRATWIAWPHRQSDWPGKSRVIGHVYSEIVRALSRFEDVEILVPSAESLAVAKRMVRRYGADTQRVHFHIRDTNRSWLRDSGAITVRDEQNELIALDWHFNAWAKYEDWALDDGVPEFMAHVRDRRRVQPLHNGKRLVLEGGSIDGNGAGLLLTTEECLLSPIQERNHGSGRADYESVFRQYLGIEKVLWLNRGIHGDDTHGHVDDLARFVGPSTIVTVVENDPADANYAPLQENLERLRGYTDMAGRKLEIVPLPMPRAVMYAGQRLPASYANFYIANGIVLVPTFNDPRDRTALEILAELFPEREVVGIHSVDLVWGLGTLHCLSQQEPQ